MEGTYLWIRHAPRLTSWLGPGWTGLVGTGAPGGGRIALRNDLKTTFSCSLLLAASACLPRVEFKFSAPATHVTIYFQERNRTSLFTPFV